MKPSPNSSLNNDLNYYYSQRALHFEDVYQAANRQTDLHDLEQRLKSVLSGKHVLEVACGTGYWTERFVDVAGSVLATDNNSDMLQIASAKPQLAGRVQFQLAEAGDLPSGNFDASFAGFLWSHLKRSEQSHFLESLQSACGSGTLLVMFDNCYVEDESIPIARTDTEGNTYQIRRLPDGSRHEVIKNYPTDSTLRKKLASYARDIRLTRNPHFWMLTCILR